MFAFDEADHLTRIHLKLALEDVGFTVREEGETVAIVPEVPARPRLGAPAASLEINETIEPASFRSS